MPRSRPVLRFAPSPNGRLHLGHAYSALFTAFWAAKLGGTFLLRIEDVDQIRSKPEFVAAIFDDLHWLGLSWPEPVMRQSERMPAYAEALGRLERLGLLYPCFCSRQQVAAAARSADPDGAPLYAGTCRGLPRAEAVARIAHGEPAQWRLDMAAALAHTGPLAYRLASPTPADATRMRAARPQDWGDVVLRRKETPTSYHLSVVVDDAAQEVTHVTRGRDLERATDVHVLLQALLELPTPIYTFHELIRDHAGGKLSKSAGSQSLAGLRAAGWTAADVRSRLKF